MAGCRLFRSAPSLAITSVGGLLLDNSCSEPDSTFASGIPAFAAGDYQQGLLTIMVLTDDCNVQLTENTRSWIERTAVIQI